MSSILKGIVSRSAPILRASTLQKAAYWSGPPRVRISFAEKAVAGTGMILIICAPIIWVTVNVKHYKKSHTE
ncbi:hypothetical protein LSH36_167g04031 [Paralvinella palmiformis]|uniref:Uncharacterized protein n=1 Tax=Paralvinella palmiformis TaxID=53620 RepID=A0AAD9JSW6_9ANNE|nr:hypothetical protein LSH36_167g04031 [Paralvinella palmiformis]